MVNFNKNAPREFLVPLEWQVNGPKVTERGDTLCVAKEDYEKLQRELDGSRADFEELSKNSNIRIRDLENLFAERDEQIKSMREALEKIVSIEDWSGGSDFELVNKMAEVAEHQLNKWSNK